MANEIAVTPTKVGVAFSDARIRNALAGVALNGGTPIYYDTNGVAQIADAATATKAQFAGIAIPTKSSGYSAGVGQAAEIVEEGEVEGFDLSGLAYWAPVYLSDTSGRLSTVAGTKSIIVGRVKPTSERDSSGNPRKVLYIHTPYNTLLT